MNHSPSQHPFVPHRLHDPTRRWPETNCYVDLWIEVLAAFGAEPEAMLGFTLGQDYEGDQFTFSKPPSEDLRRLYGVEVRELSIWRSLDWHVSRHVADGDIVILEADAYHLPDTAASTFRTSHAKTTIAVDRLDRDACCCTYWHNAMRGTLRDDDYLGVFRRLPAFEAQADLLVPYVEIASPPQVLLGGPPIREIAYGLLREHLLRRKPRNPFSAWRHDFPDHVSELLREPARLHDYAFHFTRLSGANYELLGSHLAWLDEPALLPIARACDDIAQVAKVLQFRLARGAARGRLDGWEACFDQLEAGHELVLDQLGRMIA